MSDYLDNMPVEAGDIVVCKANGPNAKFTPGKRYRVILGGLLRDDTGAVVTPSARFTLDPVQRRDLMTTYSPIPSRRDGLSVPSKHERLLDHIGRARRHMNAMRQELLMAQNDTDAGTLDRWRVMSVLNKLSNVTKAMDFDWPEEG